MLFFDRFMYIYFYGISLYMYIYVNKIFYWKEGNLKIRKSCNEWMNVENVIL